MKKKNGVGVIVGRFQVPEFHSGHRHLIETVIKYHDEVIILLGVAQTNLTLEDPLNYQIRYQMIKDSFPGIVVAPVFDNPSDIEWCKELDKLVASLTFGQSVTLYGSRDSFLSTYKGNFKTFEIEPEDPNISGTNIREKISSKDTSVDFRRGVIYSLRNQYPRINLTVDIALISVQQNYYMVLMGAKKNIKGFIFPGGFVSSSDYGIEDAAARELHEETGIFLNSGSKDLEYLGSFKIDDWRYRNKKDVIITAFFGAYYQGGSPKASDDLDMVQWVEINPDNLPSIAEHHVPLFECLIEKKGKYRRLNNE